MPSVQLSTTFYKSVSRLRYSDGYIYFLIR